MADSYWTTQVSFYETLTAAARALGVADTTLRRWLALETVGQDPTKVSQKAWQIRQGSAAGRPQAVESQSAGPKTAGPKTAGQPAGQDLTPAEAVEALGRFKAEYSRLRDEVRGLKETLAESREALADSEAAHAALLDLQAARIPEQPWQAKTASGPSTLLPVLFTSDFHAGESIEAEELDGINSYNAEIFKSRYAMMIDKTVEISTVHMGPAEYPGFIYLRGGDTISGEIHEELAATNDLLSIPALRLAFETERAGIKRLAEVFGHVHVISTTGNHGRTTRKPWASAAQLTNLETVLAWWLETAFETDPRITFHRSKSGDAMFSALGWNVLLSHGDRMGSRGGAGFIGPVATIARGHWKLYDNWARTGQVPDVILTGHMHASVKLERGYGNGAMPGYSPYARDLRASPDAPKQWLLYFHREIGVADARELILGPRPNRRAVQDSPGWAGHDSAVQS